MKEERSQKLMSENLTKREVAFFATKLQNGKNTPVLALFIPDTYDHGTVVTGCI